MEQAQHFLKVIHQFQMDSLNFSNTVCPFINVLNANPIIPQMRLLLKVIIPQMSLVYSRIS
jgi:hypothetical protein